MSCMLNRFYAWKVRHFLRENVVHFFWGRCSTWRAPIFGPQSDSNTALPSRTLPTKTGSWCPFPNKILARYLAFLRQDETQNYGKMSTSAIVGKFLGKPICSSSLQFNIKNIRLCYLGFRVCCTARTTCYIFTIEAGQYIGSHNFIEQSLSLREIIYLSEKL